jgi:hypothetical protein
MKTGRVFWGIFFLILGLIMLGDRLGFLPIISISGWRWWPLALVLIGIAVLMKNSSYRWIPLAAAGAFLGLLVAQLLNFSWIGSGVGHAEEVQTQKFLVTPVEGMTKASLVFEGGAGIVRIRDTSDVLFEAETETTLGEYVLDHDSLDDRQEVRLSLRGSKRGFQLGKIRNLVQMRLHPARVWDMTFDMGASRLDLDLEYLTVENLRLDCGASKSTIRLGARLPETSVQINAGASSIRLEVPESAGCEVRVDAPLSSKGFPGFAKVKDGTYRTDNYESATRRVNVGIDAGVSSIRVARY